MRKKPFLVLAEYDTPHFTFKIVAENGKNVEELMKKAWLKHCRQTGADKDYFNFDDVSVEELQTNTVYRDHVPFFKLKK